MKKNLKSEKNPTTMFQTLQLSTENINLVNKSKQLNNL